jgi:hypothetical protein
MNQQEETAVRQMIPQTMDRLQRASAGPDDIGSRYARLLELLWKPKATLTSTKQGPQRSNDLPLAGTLTNQIPEPHYMQFSPTNDFSWLDLEAVGDFVSGDQMTGANLMGFNPFHGGTAYPQGQDDPVWPVPTWSVDLNGNLLF